ncbi:tRNA (guanine-N2-)-methyltransferase [Saccharomycopsis crataegensis]|uniref:tRNA (Guanine-N2-)-methyltransferase n=1 Tax=Saccharomycopsis crataegensis TaxID=43959 RepID=A0AAV5QGS9_9ASCO|nr:tRNA (guanine-N2-)-methyltransferase [Saccharomycopsis crataegensis]
MGNKYLLYLAKAHLDFRRAELESLADLYNLKVDLSNLSEDSPFVIVEIENDDLAAKWISRSILCRGVYEYWGETTEDWGQLHESVKQNSRSKWEKYAKTSFKFDFIGYQGSRNQKSQVEVIEQFSYLPFTGPIRMKKPDVVFTVIEQFIENTETSTRKFFGREVGLSEREKGVLDKFDLRKRRYVGTTSFEAELSLVTVNVAQTNVGKIMYDPFVGTGSFLVTGAHFGALTIGSDIDMKPLMGKKKNTIQANFKQYGTSLNFLDTCTMDFTHNAFRKDFIIDTICCDPPYGVREGLKVLGTSRPEHFVGKENIEIDGIKAFLRKDYVPTKKAYSLGNMLDDLLDFAAKRLPIDGRLVFWMPVANDEDYTTSIPHHEKLELKYNCVQKFNKWSRRMLCYVKRDDGYEGQTIRAGEVIKNEFRNRYFSGFNEASLD